MFREQWNEFEENITVVAGELKQKFIDKVRSKNKKFGHVVKMDSKERKEEFIKWGKEYVAEVKVKAEGEKVQKAKENFYILLRNLGINDELLRQTFDQNKKELLDPVIGEAIAIICLVLGWKQKDKEAFSQALGEIGVAGIFAAKPFICLIAICGLAYGYQENFHKESFKKGGVLGFAGITAIALSPAGFVGLLAAVVTMLYLNKKLKVNRPIETQLKEIFGQIKTGAFFKEVRESWKGFESFLAKLFVKSDSSASDMTVDPS